MVVSNKLIVDVLKNSNPSTFKYMHFKVVNSTIKHCSLKVMNILRDLC